MVKNTRRKHQTTYHKCPHLLGRGSTSDAEDTEAFVLECPATVTPPCHRHDTTQQDGSKETTLTQGPNREPGEGMGTNNLLHLELKKKSSQCLSESSHHRAQGIAPLAHSPKCLQQLGLGQAEIRSLTLHLGLYLGHLLLPSHAHQQEARLEAEEPGLEPTLQYGMQASQAAA